jgi:hypothetical protein
VPVEHEFEVRLSPLLIEERFVAKKVRCRHRVQPAEKLAALPAELGPDIAGKDERFPALRIQGCRSHRVGEVCLVNIKHFGNVGGAKRFAGQFLELCFDDIAARIDEPLLLNPKSLLRLLDDDWSALSVEPNHGTGNAAAKRLDAWVFVRTDETAQAGIRVGILSIDLHPGSVAMRAPGKSSKKCCNSLQKH